MLKLFFCNCIFNSVNNYLALSFARTNFFFLLFCFVLNIIWTVTVISREFERHKYLLVKEQQTNTTESNHPLQMLPTQGVFWNCLILALFFLHWPHRSAWGEAALKAALEQRTSQSKKYNSRPLVKYHSTYN